MTSRRKTISSNCLVIYTLQRKLYKYHRFNSVEKIYVYIYLIFADVHILPISHVKTKVQENNNSTSERPSLHFGLVVLHIVILLPLATNGLI